MITDTFFFTQPFGAPEWQQQLATTLGLESTLRPRGRPAKLK